MRMKSKGSVNRLVGDVFVLLCCLLLGSCALGGVRTSAPVEHTRKPAPELPTAADVSALRRGIIAGVLPPGLSLQDALGRFHVATERLLEERVHLADNLVSAIVNDGVDRHNFLEHIPYLAVIGADQQLTTLLLHDPGEDDYWVECCFYVAVMDALRTCGTLADAKRLRAEAPQRDHEVFIALAVELEQRKTLVIQTRRLPAQGRPQ